MASCTSIIFGEDPCSVNYRKRDSRKRTSLMFHNNVLLLFPSIGMRVMTNRIYTGSKPQIFPELAFRVIKTSSSHDIHIQPHLREETHLRRGLPNSDGVSCYANASLQSVVNYKDVRRVFPWNDEGNAFRKAMLDYRSNSYVRMKDVRLFAGAIYGTQRQQDAGEFLSSLISQSASSQHTFQHLLFPTRKCAACGSVTPVQKTPNYILLNSFPPNFKREGLQGILYYNLNNWVESNINCGRTLPEEEMMNLPHDENRVCLGKKKGSVTLCSYTSVIILQFQLFSTNTSGSVSKITHFLMENSSDDLLEINRED
ncbi:hypothetical protein QAD02_013843 [Eretmocerus hayati]|uniref:Uncharacterized protein n=1 Tax=Eretmocerus hayati TaxID=131215 RepID=A0ACC2P5D8_9HYME|nr:hypothetical protein QAD02_013843 [Eretmocerus hayati]